ncbi:MAG: hypothetical protein KKB20_15810 [Proteobacteria bacterium]|nr:hypothetical protein [Pseudomonadota bacterium]
MRDLKSIPDEPRHLARIIITAILIGLLASASCGPERRAGEEGAEQKTYGVTQGSFRGRWWNHYERGLSYAEGKYWAEAESDLRAAIERRAEDQRRARTYGLHFIDYFPHRELGIVLYRQDRLEEAMAELETSLKTARSAKAEHYLDLVRKDWIELKKLDLRPPDIRIDAPLPDTLEKGFQVLVRGLARDDTYVKEILVNGTPVRIDLSTPEMPFEVTVPLKYGPNPIVVAATDLSGKTSVARLTVKCDREGPVMGIEEARMTGPGAVQLKGYVADESQVQDVTVNGRPLPIQPSGQVRLDRPISVKPGETRLLIRARDRAGNLTKADVDFAGRLDSREEAILLASLEVWPGLLSMTSTLMARAEVEPIRIGLAGWTADQAVFLDRALIEGHVRASKTVASIEINGKRVFIQPGRDLYFSHTTELKPGENRISVVVTDEAGRRAEQRFRVERKLKGVYRKSARLRLALLPPASQDASGGTDPSARDLIYRFVSQGDRFQVVDPAEVDRLISQGRLSVDDLGDREAAARAAQALGVDAALIGVVAGDGRAVDVYARVVDAETAEVVAAVDAYQEHAAGETKALACRALAEKLDDELPLIEGVVVKAEDKDVLVDLGADRKIKPGMRLIVFRDGKPGYSPATGMNLGADSIEVGRARVTHVGGQASTARVTELQTSRKIQAMDQAITR